MERLQKKCLIASVGLHSLLVLILFVGPAFLSSGPPKIKEAQILDFIPDKLVDADVTGGGNPQARRAPAPAPQPPVTQPAPPPTPKTQPEPQVKPEPKVVKTTEPDTDSLEPATDSKKKKPNISLKEVTRKDTSKTTNKKASDSDTEDQQRREYVENRNRIAGLFRNAAGNVLNGTASATTIEDPYGPGGGGPTYASYRNWVATVYDQAWIAPEDSAKDDSDVIARVTIARDGTIISARITEPSGDPQVDASVRRALARVKTIGKPFPEGAKETERTYPIHFNVKAKRGTA